ncbi:MAG: hypothetical protein WAQ08_02340 [Aquabacterium sp.]|uniref:hypothetical protein n=1 Tax=Aquabacterium sp. TaxID=1872578 RepID=UPI003BAF35B5
MSHPHPLQAHVGVLRTRVGGAFPGSRAVFRGHDLHQDPTVRNLTWVELCAFGITGRRITRDQARVIETMWVWTSYPDARIWNNRVAALAGTTRSTPNLAISAAQAVSEATIYGRRNEYRALSFFRWAHQRMLAGATVEQAIDEHLRAGKRLAGYGRPLASDDERIAPTMALARELGLADGPHVRLCFEVDRVLQAQGKPLRMNFGALTSAFGADFGFTPREYGMMHFPAFVGGMQPCYLEALDKPPGAVFPTPCDGVVYEGAAPRDWPGAAR